MLFKRRAKFKKIIEKVFGLIICFLIFIIKNQNLESTIIIPVMADATVHQYFPNKNYGNSTELWAGKTSGGNLRRSYMKFDLSPILGGPKVLSAELDMYLFTGITATALGIYYNSNDNWFESNITWNNQPSSGLESSPTDSTLVSTPGWYRWDITLPVKQEYNNKDKYLTLVLSLANESLSTDVFPKFYSKEYNQGSNAPYLKLNIVPEPLSLILLSLGLGALALRRKIS